MNEGETKIPQESTYRQGKMKRGVNRSKSRTGTSRREQGREKERERTVIASGVIQEGRIDALCSGRSNANHAGEKYGSSKIATRRGTVVIIARVLYPSRRDVSLSVREEGWLVTTSYPFYFSRRVEAGFCVFRAAYMLLTRWNFIAFLLAASFRKIYEECFWIDRSPSIQILL